MPELAGAIQGAVIQLAPDDDPGADPFSDIQEDQVLRLAVSVPAEPDLGERRQPGAVFEVERQVRVQRLSSASIQTARLSPVRDFGGPHPAFVRIHQPDQAYADALRCGPARAGLHDPLDAFGERVDRAARIGIMRYDAEPRILPLKSASATVL